MAAGRSTRFGPEDKLLARLPSGQRVIERCLATVAAVCHAPVVVTRPGNDALAEVIRAAGFIPLPCPDADLGMGHSLAFGAQQISQGRAILVTLADLPFTTPQTLMHLAQRISSETEILIPIYRGRRGHPVVFGAAWRSRLTDLTGDSGARALISCSADVVELPVDDPGVIHAVDTKNALAGPAV